MRNSIRVFILKSDERSHACIEGAVISTETATVRGRLFEHAGGEAMLDVPGMDVIAMGTLDGEVDTAVQNSIRNWMQIPLGSEFGEWRDIEGELLTIEDAPWLLLLDRANGFCPNFFSNHRRVLVPVIVDGRVTVAWCYTIGQFMVSHATLSERTC